MAAVAENSPVWEALISLCFLVISRFNLQIRNLKLTDVGPCD